MNALECPQCHQRMRFPTFFKGMTPWHLNCAGCGVKVRIGRFRVLSFVLACLYGGFLAWACILAFKASRGKPIYPIALFLAGVLAGESLFYRILLAKGVPLESRGPPGILNSPPKEEEPPR